MMDEKTLCAIMDRRASALDHGDKTHLEQVVLEDVPALVAEVKTLGANAAKAVAFLERRYGNRGGNDWGDDEAAHIAEMLDGNVNE